MMRLLCLFCLTTVLFTSCTDSKEPKFNIIETSIADIHKAVKAGEITFVELTRMYLDRIEKYDQPTKLNSLVVINPNALKRAEELDLEFARNGKLRPLHGIPIIVKDNYDTFDLQTSGGSLALKGSIPPDDAFQVKKIREAGAIVLAKSNMAEWAFSPYLTESSIAGVTRNPYDLIRVPAGSSGGTAASVAANLGTAGLGTDTGNSIRGPSSHNSLVGIRSTLGATSRDGIIPLYFRNDVGGPMARTVEDAARIFEVLAGYDPADPLTEYGKDKVHANYTQFLDKNGLKGARIGVFRKYTDRESTDPEIVTLFETAIVDLQKLGAEVVDPFVVPDFDNLRRGMWCDAFQHDVNLYLASLGENAPYKTLQEIYDAGIYSDYVKERIENALSNGLIAPEEREEPYFNAFEDARRVAFRDAIIKIMDKLQLDAIVFPTWSNQPRKIGDMESPAGDNSQQICPATGMPGITVPMGLTSLGLPTGLQIVARMFNEDVLFKLAFSYEQGTLHRKPPKGF